MRILYTGIFGAAMMRPISGGGLWLGIFSLAFLFPLIIGIRGIVQYIRLIKHGIKTYATIYKTDKLHGKSGYYYVRHYSYFAGETCCGGIFQTGSRSRKYAEHQKIEVRYDKNAPERHIRVKDSLWESIGILFLSGIFFFGMFVQFLGELIKCF